MLDKELNFTIQVDYAVSKGKRACAKVGSLIDGRRGVNIQIGVGLYTSLVRPHLEYALPAWANISDKDLEKLELTQVQCLKPILGAKVHTSSAAVEVICGIIPIRFRQRELCSREFMWIITKKDGHDLVQLLSSSTRVGLRFCLLEFLRIMSKELIRAIDGFDFIKPESYLPNPAADIISNRLVVGHTDYYTVSDKCTSDSKLCDITDIFDVYCNWKYKDFH